MKEIFELLFTFFKIGLFTFGGGYAMIPMIEGICVEKKGWISHEDMMNITVVAESTPGPVAVNCATFVGYKKKGFIGACAATLGVIIPSFIVIYIIANFLDNFLEIGGVASAFKAIKLAVGILIFDAALRMLKKLPKSTASWVIFIVSTVVTLYISFFSVNFSSIAMILIAGVTGLLISLFKGNLHKEEGRQ